MASELADYLKGDEEPANDETDDQLQIPDDLDIDKFNRGRDFFKKNVGQCLLTMMMSLIVGLSIERFLKVLVCTGMSSTPKSSFKRYMSTTMHVLKWHYGNVWDKKSSAFRSICAVRKMHAHARNLMNKKGNRNEEEVLKTTAVAKKQVYLSHYEMGLVQSGFMGIVVMYHREYGIHCSTEVLDDYVYFWRWIGYLLGIKDKYNICLHGYQKAKAICHAIENEIVIPALKNPPVEFFPMADAFVYGFKHHPLASTKSIIAVGFLRSRIKCPFSLSSVDTIRMYFMSGFISVLSYFPLIAFYFNRLVEKIFQCQKLS